MCGGGGKYGGGEYGAGECGGGEYGDVVFISVLLKTGIKQLTYRYPRPLHVMSTVSSNCHRDGCINGFLSVESVVSRGLLGCAWNG